MICVDCGHQTHEAGKCDTPSPIMWIACECKAESIREDHGKHLESLRSLLNEGMDLLTQAIRERNYAQDKCQALQAKVMSLQRAIELLDREL